MPQAQAGMQAMSGSHRTFNNLYSTSPASMATNSLLQIQQIYDGTNEGKKTGAVGAGAAASAGARKASGAKTGRKAKRSASIAKDMGTPPSWGVRVDDTVGIWYEDMQCWDFNSRVANANYGLQPVVVSALTTNRQCHKTKTLHAEGGVHLYYAAEDIDYTFDLHPHNYTEDAVPSEDQLF